MITIEKMNKGIAMLTAIVVTGILALVAFGISNIAFKQLLLSNYQEDSNQAFYNADSGVECALYWDLKGSSGVSAFSTSTPSSIACGGENISTGSQSGIPAVSPPVSSVSRIGGGGNGNPSSIFQLNLTRGCAIVVVTKSWTGIV